MSAYACEPNMGSEAGVGWNWAAQAALQGHEVHVITRSNNRAVIEEEQGVRPMPRPRLPLLRSPLAPASVEEADRVLRPFDLLLLLAARGVESGATTP